MTNNFNWLDFMDAKLRRNVKLYGDPKQTLWPWLGGHITTQTGKVVRVAKPRSYVSYKAPTLGNEAFQCESRFCEEKNDA